LGKEGNIEEEIKGKPGPFAVHRQLGGRIMLIYKRKKPPVWNGKMLRCLSHRE
jgi:hypothetical protein